LIFLLKRPFFQAAKVWEDRRNGKKTGIKLKKKYQKVVLAQNGGSVKLLAGCHIPKTPFKDLT
jgi:hypothetical protein